MKKTVITGLLLCALGLTTGGRASSGGEEMPALHTITSVSLSPSYSCRPKDDVAKGYEGTALFLSQSERGRNTPDLLFNGACGSQDYFEAATAGDDMSLIADLGVGVKLEEVTTQRAFNLQGVHSFDLYSKFARTAKVEVNHTYAVLLNGSTRRGLFVFTVTKYSPNKQVDLQYDVKSYQLATVRGISSPGFAWDR